MKFLSFSITAFLFLPLLSTILILITGHSTGGLQVADAQPFGRRRFGPRRYGYSNPVDHRRGSRFRGSRFLKV